ncbi:O-antigen ligase family protein, partial [Patulibacter sp. S7RM1-6]
RTGTVATLLVAAVAAVVVVAAVGNPVAWTRDRVGDALHGGYADVPASGSRLTGSLGSNRGDMYRVAWRTFRAHPLTGVGAEDFGPAYLRGRRSDEAPRYAHSFPLGVLAGLGAVGAALWLLVLGLPAVLAHRRRRRMRPATRAGMAAALTGAVAWALQAAVDWTWAFPAVTVPALVLLAAAAR